ncbi:MAG TPA: GAF domain-containing protein [Caulobacteraceae bacterium]
MTADSSGRPREHGIADEQAALRRVAVLVARAAPPDQVFTAVTEEAGRLLGAGQALMSRYDPDGAGSVVAAWGSAGAVVPVGTRMSLGGRNVATLVAETGRAARLDEYVGVSGAAADIARETGVRTAVGAPISVEGRLWGVIILVSTREQPLPTDTEEWLAGFTELAGTAIASAQAGVELRGFAEEQGALRRVATLVARAAAPEEVFAAVAAEAGRLLRADATLMSRYDPDAKATVVGAWTSTGGTPAPLGTRLSLGGRDLHTLVFRSGRSARIDDYGAASASAAAADIARETGVRSGAGVPISVEGRLWGVIGIASGRELPPDTEARLAGFTELAATAIANAETQAALAASRARLVATTDQARRRIERDLHDGAQQRLVALALRLREAQAALPETGELAQRLDGAVSEVNGVLEELREVARGIHPAILTESGLRPALRALARRSAVPVSLDVQVAGRLPEPVEFAAYHAVSEALANVAKYAQASAAEVEIGVGDGVLRVDVRDDGRGGADVGRGSGLLGLKDRVEALGGWISLRSEAGAGTVMQIALPLRDPG